MNRTAQLISVVFHPLLMTTYLFIVLSLFLPGALQPVRPSLWFIFLIFLMTFILPALNVLFFRVTGTVKDMQMYDRAGRIMPFTFIAILYCLVTFMFYWKFPVPGVLRLMEIITLMVVVSTVVTMFYKVSVHSVAVCGVIGILLALNNASDGMLLYPSIAALLIGGLVMSSRLQLNAHVLREVLYGAAIGFIIGIGGVVTLL